MWYMWHSTPCPGETLSGDVCRNAITPGRTSKDGTCGQCKGSRSAPALAARTAASLDNASLLDAPPPIETATISDDDLVDQAILAVLTEATCGTSCWEAREDVCRCSCGGKNHGIATQGKRAARTCKAGRARYELVAVVAESDKPYTMAADMSEAATGDRPRGTFAMRPSWGQPPLFAVQPSSKAQQQWPEIGQAFDGWNERKPGEAFIDLHRRRPHLIWKRTA